MALTDASNQHLSAEDVRKWIKRRPHRCRDLPTEYDLSVRGNAITHFPHQASALSTGRRGLTMLRCAV
jgi:hypothetical protein